MSAEQTETGSFNRTVRHIKHQPTAGDVLERLKSAVGASSDRELSIALGHSPTAISNRRQRGTLPLQEAMQVAMTRGHSLDWLVFGVDPGMPSRELAAESQDYVGVPLFDIEAACGEGRTFSAERVLCYLHFRRDWVAAEGLYEGKLAALRVVGDSMSDTLQDGDTALINRHKTSGDGVFLLRIGDALRIKRIQRLTDGALRLSSDNEHYAPEVIPPERLTADSPVEIIGHCHWRGGRVY